MRIGIDLDNTINENNNTIHFFSMLTNAFKDNIEIHIITNRDICSYESTAKELKDMHIYFDFIHITAEKSKLIIDKGITIYFDDTDEYFLELPEEITVFKIREGGNFDFNMHKWIYGNKTGINIDKSF